MKNDDVIKRTSKCSHPRVMLITNQKGNIRCAQCKALWISEKNLLAEIERAREKCYEQMDEIINVSVASGEIDIIKHSFHSKLQALKEEL